MKTFLLELVIDNFLKKRVLNFFPDKYFIILEYYIYSKKLPNLKNPVTFSEKMQWVKIHGNLEKFSKYADKYEVRKYVAKTIGEKHLVPILGVWNTFEEIPFNKFPNKFILKSTNGSGDNFVCEDKSKINKQELKKTVDEWMSYNYYYDHREPQYKLNPQRIICEEYLGDGKQILQDYKFFCSNGVPKLIEVYTDAFTDPREDLLDLNWKNLNIKLHYPNSEKVIKKPKQLPEMINISRKLSKIFPFVRVDLYVYKNNVYFGELTLTPGNGMYIEEPPQADIEVGKLIDLSKYRKHII